MLERDGTRGKGEGSCGHGNDPSSNTIRGDCIHYLSYYQLVKRSAVVWTYHARRDKWSMDAWSSRGSGLIGSTPRWGRARYGGAGWSSEFLACNIRFSLFVAVKEKTLYMIMWGLERARHAMSNCRLRMRVDDVNLLWSVVESVTVLCARNTDRATAFCAALRQPAGNVAVEKESWQSLSLIPWDQRLKLIVAYLVKTLLALNL